MAIYAVEQANRIFQKATPVLHIHDVGGKHWRRNVAKGSRVDPWLQAKYAVLDPETWGAQIPCMYLVAGLDGRIRYVGISRNRMKDRWRISPAYP